MHIIVNSIVLFFKVAILISKLLNFSLSQKLKGTENYFLILCYFVLNNYSTIQ